MSNPLTPQEITDLLGLEELPVEGGRWAQSWRGEECSAIYYLLAAPDFSALHRLDRFEIYSYHAGAPSRMLLLSDGQVSEPVLGPHLAEGQRPQIVVPAGVWQAVEPLGEWSLMGTVAVPPYTDDCVEFGDATALCAQYPKYTTRIKAFCG